jgi:pimeloyl-ACP methyl ester carboxylesterase
MCKGVVLMQAPEMKLTNVNGMDLELFDSGGPGDPVLLVRSTHDDCYRFISETSLPENFRVILHHRRGVGQSTSECFPYSFAEHGADYRMVLQHLALRKHR